MSVKGGSKPLSLQLGDEKAISDAMKIAGPSTEKEFKVFGHGNSDGIQFNGEILNANQVARLINNSPKYIGGNQIVKLYSCDTGRNPNGFAQRLANNLGSVVEAPNNLLYPTKKGDFTVASKLFEKGGWVKFFPQK